jgi:sigma-B regulation protein RsbU (phosphoserine phosphatase)
LVAGLQARIQSIAALHGDSVGELVTEVNRGMHSATDSNRYATLFYGVWNDESRQLTYVNAGHNPPMLLRAGKGDRCEVHQLGPDGSPVGMLHNALYRESQLSLEAGDVLLIYTDGLTEAPNPEGEEFGPGRLEAFAREHLDLGAATLRDAILAEVERFAGGPTTNDDLTLVVARVR